MGFYEADKMDTFSEQMTQIKIQMENTSMPAICLQLNLSERQPVRAAIHSNCARNLFMFCVLFLTQRDLLNDLMEKPHSRR